jgi:hypothetical protein
MDLCAERGCLVDTGLGAILVVPKIGSRHLLLELVEPRL